MGSEVLNLDNMADSHRLYGQSGGDTLRESETEERETKSTAEGEVLTNKNMQNSLKAILSKIPNPDILLNYDEVDELLMKYR